MAKGQPDRNGNITYPFQLNGGVNVLNHPISIADNQMVACANMFPDQSGILMKRPGITNIELLDIEQAAPNDFRYYPLDIGLPDPALGFNYLMHYLYDTASVPGVLNEKVSLFNPDFIAGSAGGAHRPAIILNNGDFDGATNPLSIVNYNNRTLVVGTKDIIANLLPNVTVDGFHYWRSLAAPGINPVVDYHATFVHNAATQVGVPTNQTQSVPVRPRVACVYAGGLSGSAQVVYGNFGPGMGNWLVFADTDTPNHTNNDVAPMFTNVGNDVLAFNGRHIELAEASGENIVLMRNIMLQSVGSPIQAALLVVTAEGSCFIITGGISQTFEDNSSNFSAAKINYKVGCTSANTFVHTPYGYMWADNNDVWLLVQNTPVRVGTLIGNKLSSYPPDTRKWWSAGYVDYKYVLQCVSVRGTNDAALQREQWWLDLTQGPPPHTLAAKWYGPMTMLRDSGETDGFSRLSEIVTDADSQRIVGLSSDNLYTLSNFHGLSLIDYTSAFGSDDFPFRTVPDGLEWQANTAYAVGDIIRPGFYQNLGVILICTGAGTSGGTEPVWTAGNSGAAAGYSDGSVTWGEIQGSNYRLITNDYTNESYVNGMDILTKEFIPGRPEVDKVLKAVDLYAFSSQPQVITAELRRNQGANQSVLSSQKDLSALFGQDINAFKAGVSDLNNATITRGQMEGKSLRPAEGAVQRFKSAQLHIFEGIANALHADQFVKSPYIIDTSNNTIVFGFYNSSGVFQLLQASLTLLPSGYIFYASIEALYTAIVAAMNAAITAGTTYPSSGPGITVGATPFTYVAPRASNSQDSCYFNSIKCAGTAKDVGSGFALFFGDSNAATVAGNAGTFDLLKSKRLMALIGMSTEQSANAQQTHGAVSLPAGTYFSPPSFQYEAFTGTNALHLFAKEMMPYTRSSNIYLAEAVLRGRTTTTDPLSFSNR